jgi:hypothetical protein
MPGRAARETELFKPAEFDVTTRFETITPEKEIGAEIGDAAPPPTEPAIVIGENPTEGDTP